MNDRMLGAPEQDPRTRREWYGCGQSAELRPDPTTRALREVDRLLAARSGRQGDGEGFAIARWPDDKPGRSRIAADGDCDGNAFAPEQGRVERPLLLQVRHPCKVSDWLRGTSRYAGRLRHRNASR